MSAYSSLILAESSLVAFWRLNEAAGATSVADSKGSLTGTPANCTFGGAGIPGDSDGASVLANGTSSAIETATLSIPAPISVECWFKTSNANQHGLFINKNPAAASGWALLLETTLPSLNWYQGSSLNAREPSNDAWHHVVATQTGTTAKIYIDGWQQDTAGSASALPNGAGTLSLLHNSTTTDGTGGRAYFYSGSLCNVAIYNSVLTLTQVQSHYQAGFNHLGQRNLCPPRPARPVVQSGWKRDLAVALVPGQEAGAASIPNLVNGVRTTYQTSTMARVAGPWGPELVNTHTGSGGLLLGRPIPNAATQFTLSSLCTADAFADLSHLWGGENTTSANMRVSLYLTGGGLSFQVGVDGAFTNLTATIPALNTPYLITCRLAPGGVRSIWFGPYKVAERTDAAAAYGSGGETNGSGWGGSPQNGSRAWSGRLTVGYVWNRALSDAEIMALAADPFVPVRPGKVSMPVLALGSGALGNRRRRILLCSGGG